MNRGIAVLSGSLILVVGLAAGLAVFAMAERAHAQPATMPDPQLTPGKVCVTDIDIICNTKWGKDPRAVTQGMKNRVFEEYGISPDDRHLPNGKSAFEVDHLISRELGGCDAIENLWPEPYTGPLNAHMKDRVENRLHEEVCAGRLSLGAAQEAIRQNWVEQYIIYFGNP